MSAGIHSFVGTLAMSRVMVWLLSHFCMKVVCGNVGFLTISDMVLMPRVYGHFRLV